MEIAKARSRLLFEPAVPPHAPSTPSGSPSPVLFGTGEDKVALDLHAPGRYPRAMPSLRAAYDLRLASGDLTPDAGQQLAVQHLDRLLTELQSTESRSLFRKPAPPRGLYLWGPVGRGKSMLMDMFFEAAPTVRKRRTHFHVFMAEIHHLLNDWRSGTPASRRARFGHTKGDDPVPPLADMILRQSTLLCFDELQVTDIADAMILGRLFDALFQRGVTLVSTSNRPPDDLYRDGINRQLFLPFIALLKQKMEIVSVAGPLDHRAVEARRRQAWLSPIDPDNERTLRSTMAGNIGRRPRDRRHPRGARTQRALAPRQRRPIARELRQPLHACAWSGGLSGHRRGLPRRLPRSHPKARTGEAQRGAALRDVYA